jgi:hypothetical protein
LIAACLAISTRLDLGSKSALAFPPFSPPSLPRATAAGFFSFVLERSGMSKLYAIYGQKQLEILIFVAPAVYNSSRHANG